MTSSLSLGELGDGDGAQSTTAIVHFFKKKFSLLPRWLALCLQESLGGGGGGGGKSLLVVVSRVMAMATAIGFFVCGRV